MIKFETCDIATTAIRVLVKERLLIGAEDETYNTQIDEAIEEAKCYVWDALQPYINCDDDCEATVECNAQGRYTWVFCALPPTVYPCELCVILADIGAAIFKRRHMPKDFDQGYWNQGIKRLEKLIRNTFHQGTVRFSDYGEDD